MQCGILDWIPKWKKNTSGKNNDNQIKSTVFIKGQRSDGIFNFVGYKVNVALPL